MNALGIIRELEDRGIRLALGDGGKLVVDAPKGTLKPEEIERLREIKAVLVEALQGERFDSGNRKRDAYQPIPFDLVMEVRRIEAEAYRLGWSRERLWNRDFWPHAREHPRGLAAVLEPGDRVVEVYCEYMAIERAPLGGSVRPTRLRFWRSDA